MALPPTSQAAGRQRQSERLLLVAEVYDSICVLGGILGCPEWFGLLVLHNAKNVGLVLRGLLLHVQHVRGR